jgi:phage terminase small subunit
MSKHDANKYVAPRKAQSKRPKNPWGLSVRKWLFAQEYVVDGNGTQAVIRAGYAVKGAATQAHRLLRNAKVNIAIRELRRQRSHEIGLRADDARRQWKLIVDFEIGQIFDFSGDTLALRAAKDITPDARACIKSIKVKRKMERQADGSLELVEIIEFTMHDKLRAIWDAVKADRLFESEREQFQVQFPEPPPPCSEAKPVNYHVIDPEILQAVMRDFEAAGIALPKEDLFSDGDLEPRRRGGAAREPEAIPA